MQDTEHRRLVWKVRREPSLCKSDNTDHDLQVSGWRLSLRIRPLSNFNRQEGGPSPTHGTKLGRIHNCIIEDCSFFGSLVALFTSVPGITRQSPKGSLSWKFGHADVSE